MPPAVVGEHVTRTDTGLTASTAVDADAGGSADETAESHEPGPGTASSYAAARFGMGFIIGMALGGVAGVVTGAFGPAVLVGFSLGLVLGVAAMELE
jgi:hypothetical protein